MPSIVFTTLRHLKQNQGMSWVPGVLFIHGKPYHLGNTDYVYVCHRNHILFRAKWERTVWLKHKVATIENRVGGVKRNPPQKSGDKIDMPDYRRAYLKGGTLFFTAVTYKRYPIFEQESAIALLRRCFKSVMAEYPFSLDAIVILPDHLHCIWTLPDDDCDFSVRWKRIKVSFTRNYSGSTAGDISASMRKKKEKGIWQRRFWEHLIRDDEDFKRHCDYIHYNPVKHGLVDSPIEWEYSSLRKFVEKGLYPRTWGQKVDRELLEMDLE